MKGAIEIDTYIYLSEKDKQITSVGFSKKEIKNHKGISGLKYYLIILYLRKHVQTFGQITLTLNDLLQEFGYSTKTNNKSIYSDFREIIKTEIINKGYASCNKDIFIIKPNDLFHLQMSYENNIFFTEDNFVQITIFEYENICSISSKINKSVLLGIYLYIKQFIMDYSGDITPAKISFPSKLQIAKGLDISVQTVESGLLVLESNKLIYIRRDMFVENKKEEGIYVPTRNVYALDPKELEGKSVLIELERIYGKRIYNKEDVPGEIRYLTKSKGE
ncbi:hypothetical protein H8S00_05240 [Eubacterium sp. BX4]|uniref:Uncharacterized protein n=1 Tax=Eubacterium segne TaxID=2763045 RepID=A0ABR7F1B6_9FIRM|nr:hypothetical protein [Eubacterium segne]MBC5667391.1 hypothetical protein [Eubacterium segne]